MLVQELDDRLRLIRQQDHAQLSGALAHAWRAPRRPPADGGAPAGAPGAGSSSTVEALPYRVVWATGVHDAAWTGLDRRPVLDRGSGRPFDFHRLPLERKLGPYRRGVDRVAALDPYAGLQVSRHYASFLDGRAGDGDVEAFVREERERQAELRAELPRRLRDDDLLDRELAWLKLFDTLSLYVCLTGPGVEPATRPDWLARGDRLETPAGRELDLGWRSPGELVLDPCPAAAPVALRVPFRTIPREHASQEELEASWRRVRVEHRTVRVGPARRG